MTVALTDPMRELLWRVAQHKYGWKFVASHGGEHRVAKALHDRGLVRHDLTRNLVLVTDAGKAEIRRRWPVSPCGEGTYDRSDWTLRHDDHVQRPKSQNRTDHPEGGNP